MSHALEHRDVRRQTSPLHGTGVFTLRPFTQGEPVFTFEGPSIAAADVRDDMRVMQIAADQYLVEDPAADYIENYVNHSCNPNLGFTTGSTTLHALRDIAPHEELTWDYSTSINDPGWSIPCRCNSPHCRGNIQSFQDLPPHIQQQLHPITLSYLRP
ncbi:MAG: SET domain-containing protein-lysine N-methyltransferase [Phycisphaeraceae bacterium]